MADRRIVLRLLAAAPLLAASAAARAQAAGKVWRIGWLGPASGPNEAVEAFRVHMNSLGYVEGRNLQYEFRWAANQNERLPALAEELVRLKVDVIAAQATLPVVAAMRATSTIPIVMTAAGDPVGAGLVASLARPGGNVTGMSNQSTDLAGKHLQMLREVVPSVRRVALLVEKGVTSGELYSEQLRIAGKPMGVTVTDHWENDPAMLAALFAAMQRARAQALIVRVNPFTAENRRQIVDLAAKHSLPAVYENRTFVDAGGLLSYGPDLKDLFRRAATLVDRIFKGAKPADLPVEQPNKFELVINLKTARALGIKVPQAVLVRADEVIQ